jgi:hypothetical protein
MGTRFSAARPIGAARAISAGRVASAGSAWIAGRSRVAALAASPPRPPLGVTRRIAPGWLGEADAHAANRARRDQPA